MKSFNFAGGQAGEGFIGMFGTTGKRRAKHCIVVYVALTHDWGARQLEQNGNYGPALATAPMTNEAWKYRNASPRATSMCYNGKAPADANGLAEDLQSLGYDNSTVERFIEAAAVNSTRNALFFALRDAGLPIEASTGGRTKWNRSRLGIPKAHCLDALCVGNVSRVEGWRRPVLQIKATGRGSYKRTRLTADGFPRGFLIPQKQVFGFQTGDIVRAVVSSGKNAGTHKGRVAIRAAGSFNIQIGQIGQTGQRIVQGVSHRHCRIIQRGDGYGYSTREIQAVIEAAPIPPRPSGRGLSARN